MVEHSGQISRSNRQASRNGRSGSSIAPPESPSIPNLKKGAPLRIPGLESEDDCFSLCLTPDMKHIVFGKVVIRDVATVDLFMASRDSVTEAFPPAQAIESTLGPETECCPALSADGLELYFIRSDANPMIWVTRRSSLKEPFGSAEEWASCKSDEQSSRVGTPQCLSASEIVFSRIDTTTGVRTLWSCDRQSGNLFSPPKLYAAPSGAPTLFFNNDGRRGYYCSVEDGLFVAWRPSLTSPLGQPQQLIPGTSMGVIDGTIWVAPKEDVMFYCSPGPGIKAGSPRKLWMSAF